MQILLKLLKYYLKFMVLDLIQNIQYKNCLKQTGENHILESNRLRMQLIFISFRHTNAAI